MKKHNVPESFASLSSEQKDAVFATYNLKSYSKNKKFMSAAINLIDVANNTSLPSKEKEQLLKSSIDKYISEFIKIAGFRKVDLEFTEINGSDEKSLGFYSPLGHTINLCLHDIKPVDILHIINHELRHAIQYNQPKTSELFNQLVGGEKYFSSDGRTLSENTIRYFANLQEVDADLFGLKLTEQICDQALSKSKGLSKPTIAAISNTKNRTTDMLHSEINRRASYITITDNLSKLEDSLSNWHDIMKKTFSSTKKISDLEKNPTFTSIKKDMDKYYKSIKETASLEFNTLAEHPEAGSSMKAYESLFFTRIAKAYENISAEEILLSYAYDPVLNEYMRAASFYNKKSEIIPEPIGLKEFNKKYLPILNKVQAQLDGKETDNNLLEIPGQSLTATQRANIVLGAATYSFVDDLQDSSGMNELNQFDALLSSGVIDNVNIATAMTKVANNQPIAISGVFPGIINNKRKILENLGIENTVEYTESNTTIIRQTEENTQNTTAEQLTHVTNNLTQTSQDTGMSASM